MEFISNFIQQWLGTALPQLFLLFLGILLVILVVTALWDRRINRLGGIFGVVIGLFMASVALEENIARFIGELDPGLRIRLLAILCSLSLLILTGTAWLKTGLQKRYGLTWTTAAFIVLLTALFPDLLRSFPSLLGVHYSIALAGLFIGFLLLLVFHFSITISELHVNQQCLLERIRQLEQGEDSMPPQSTAPQNAVVRVQEEKNGFLNRIGEKLRKLSARLIRRPERGTSLGAPLIIFITVCAVFFVGLSAPQVMVGDEVTHYYMLKTQAEILPQPNFTAEIPTGWGTKEIRRYPHSFGWHYLGAVIYRITGGSFAAIQLYQALFLAQFLGVAYMLARSRGGIESRSALLYLLILASIPMTLIFSVTFYQGMPMAAQVLTAFYLLRKKRWLPATLFMGFALWLKVTAVLFFPVFFLCLFIWTVRRCSLRKTGIIFCCSLLLICLCTWGLGRTIKVYAGSTFYPAAKLEIIWHLVQKKITTLSQEEQVGKKQPSSVPQQGGQRKQQLAQQDSLTGNTAKDQAKVISEQQASIIANHPGDLRIKANYFIYGGLLLWLLIFTGALAALLRLIGFLGTKPAQGNNERSCWLWGVGLSYTFIAAFFLKSAPDARFFFPGLPFLLLPVAEQAVRLPRPKWIISLLAALALLQGGYVLAKTYKLRQITPELQEAIFWLQEHPPVPAKIFMYPEGNYRLFPVPHEWYMNYHLREFWRADNDLRLEILRRFHIGAIVVKKYLVAPVDKNITNLGVYPDYFVQDLQHDDRFYTVFENKDILILKIPVE